MSIPFLVKNSEKSIVVYCTYESLTCGNESVAKVGFRFWFNFLAFVFGREPLLCPRYVMYNNNTGRIVT